MAPSQRYHTSPEKEKGNNPETTQDHPHKAPFLIHQRTIQKKHPLIPGGGESGWGLKGCSRVSLLRAEVQLTKKGKAWPDLGYRIKETPPHEAGVEGLVMGK